MQPSTRRFQRALLFHLLTSFYQDANFLFQQASAPVHSAKTTTEWFSDHLISASDWAANLPDLKPSENLQSTVKRKMKKHIQTT